MTGKKLFVYSALALFMAVPAFAGAQAVDQARLIQQLQKQIEVLTSQVHALQQQIGAVRGELGASASETATAPEAIPPELTRTLTRGTSGDDVRSLQEFLARDKEIYPEGLLTGFFGPLTEAAVKKWQEKHRIESVGVIGPKTIAKFQELGKGVVQGLIQQGAGASGVIPPGLLTAPGIQKKLEVSAATASSTRSATATTTPSGTIPAQPATPAVPSSGGNTATSVTPATPATGTPPPPPPPAATSTPALPPPPPVSLTAYGSALNLSNVSNLFGKIWGPGSNGIIIGGGLNFSTQPGVGWSQQYGGVFVTSYSLQSAQSNYLTQTSPVSVGVIGPAGSIIEVWDLESLTVIATNKTNPGSTTTFTAQPNHRYGGFAWYADNSQRNLEIHAAYSSSPLPPLAVYYEAYNTHAENITASGAQIKWSSTVPASSAAYYYDTVLVNSDANWILVSSRCDSSGLVSDHCVQLSNLQPAKRYYYRTQARIADGSTHNSQEYSFDTAATTTSPPPPPPASTADTTPPSMPAGLSATAVSSTQINLSWSAATDNVGVMGYKVYRGGTQIATVTTGAAYSNTDLAAATAYSYTVAAYDAAGNVSAQSSPVSATTLSAGPPAPSNFDGATSGDIQSQPPRIGLNLTFNYALQSTTKSLNVYMKKPSDAAFTKYTYPDPANLPVVPGWLPLPAGTTPSFYRQPDKWMWRIYDQVADTVWEMGEYKFYVTAADTNGAESVPTATKSFKFYRAPTIVSPANGSTVSVTPRITITEDPAAVSLGLALYKKNNDWINVPGWWPAPRDFTYNGPALTADGNPHRLVAYSAGALNERSLNAVSVFNVSSTISSLDPRTQNLATIFQALEAIREKLVKLLQEL